MRARFNDLLEEGELPVGEVVTEEDPDKGFVLASLRTGGASHKFETTRDISTVAWDLRVDAVKTLEHYLQEVQASTVLAKLPQRKRDRVLTLAAAAPDAIVKGTQLLKAKVPTAYWRDIIASGRL